METLNPRPQSLKVEDLGSSLVVTRTWYAPSVWLIAVFCVIWNAFMVNWYREVLSRPFTDNLAFWFPLIHVGVGVYLAYVTLTGFVNRSVIKVGDGKIIVRHGPLPWPGNKTIESADVRQLFCDEVVRRGRGVGQSSFRLNAVMKDNRKEVLLAAGVAKDEALYIERLAEARLGIVPAPVVGELS